MRTSLVGYAAVLVIIGGRGVTDGAEHSRSQGTLRDLPAGKSDRCGVAAHGATR